ncbi:MAG: hypothetical protein JW953_16685 [Anaerolineae bacterium]|nr:hypothetical protein [Anaerolineae bacterium]
MKKNLALIRASELTQYDFCHRAWWLGSVKNMRPADPSDQARGVQFHSRHARQIRAALRWHYVGLALLGGGSFLLILTVVFSMF